MAWEGVLVKNPLFIVLLASWSQPWVIRPFFQIALVHAPQVLWEKS